MGILLDTNILSELRKGRNADPKVLAWSETVSHQPQYISVLTLGEIRKGISVIERKDPAHAKILDQWRIDLQVVHSDEILPICARVAIEWGVLQAERSFPVIDGLLAATARVHSLTIATRNTSDFKGVDVPVLNPFLQGA